MRLSIDLDENLIEMPTSGREGAHPVNPFAVDLGSKHRAKPVPPEPHGIMTNSDAALGQQVLKVAKRQAVFHAHHDHEPNALRRRIEMPEWALGLGNPAQIAPLASIVNFALTTPLEGQSQNSNPA